MNKQQRLCCIVEKSNVSTLAASPVLSCVSRGDHPVVSVFHLFHCYLVTVTGENKLTSCLSSKMSDMPPLHLVQITADLKAQAVVFLFTLCQ